ncbi:solute carrier family 35 member F2-like isoform X2 [Corticium candelabrum]|uniref:solute carrier family 35 member F2-like isoform X2 n=1 Tax=Corticium candelabrum TaxID=121492 RepID=UPI002E27355A|nr:solute carrier family 35 member F2-like isoform X2 [Corticium candelabrum]
MEDAMLMTDVSDDENTHTALLCTERKHNFRRKWSSKLCEPITRSNFRKILKTIAIGQVLSVCLCAGGVANQALQRRQFNAPMIQSFTFYYLLAVTYGTVLVWRQSRQGVTAGLLEVLRMRGWKYLVIATADVEATYTMVLAYQYTSMTSIQLLDSFAIVGVMILSWFILKVRYRLIHYLGIVICVTGTVALVFADTHSSQASGSASNPVLGDALVLLGTMLLSISNVGQEYIVKQFDWIEFVGMIGILGSVISGIQVLIIERNALDSINWSSNGTPIDIYSFICGLFIFDYKFSALYCVSFAVIATGLVVYNLKPTHIKTNANFDADISTTSTRSGGQ